MSSLVLITGGAGFIGSHLADELLAAGFRVRVLDSLCEQVHGPSRARPGYLDPEVELVAGDVRDPRAVAKALSGAEAVFHLAARVGVGQSMYEVLDYTDVNDTGTAVLLQALLGRPVRRLVVASSMSVYGEGLYATRDGIPVENARRDQARAAKGHWDILDAAARPLVPLPTPETKPPSLASVYALNKYAQERLCLLVCASARIEATALRLFNVYGTRQALSNPYTGVLAIFASRLLNGNPPVVFEDGEQRRDFVNVKDVARACRLALESPASAGEVLNIGSGSSVTIASLARKLPQVVGREDIEPEVTGRCRVGDIRHCFADTTKARMLLGFEPAVGLDHGLAELAEWLSGQTAVDRFESMARELAGRGLTL